MNFESAQGEPLVAINHPNTDEALRINDRWRKNKMLTNAVHTFGVWWRQGFRTGRNAAWHLLNFFW